MAEEASEVRNGNVLPIGYRTTNLHWCQFKRNAANNGWNLCKILSGQMVMEMLHSAVKRHGVTGVSIEGRDIHLCKRIGAIDIPKLWSMEGWMCQALDTGP